MPSKLVSLTVAALLLAAVGCAAPTVEETEGRGEVSSEMGAGAVRSGRDIACEKKKAPNPACNAELFVVQAFKAMSEDSTKAIGVGLAAKTCLTNLSTIGAVGAVSNVAAPIVVSAVAVTKGLETIVACGEVVQLFIESGIFENLQCFFQPTIVTPEYDECVCTYRCTKEGINVSRAGASKRERAQNTKFKYGYIDATSQCQCTNDASVAAED